MKILLVNSNPVVSRLTALSARKESVELDEIKDISELKKSEYNIVFVDSEAFNIELSNVLKNLNIKRKVLFYTQDDKEIDEIFNFTILKPFLPSEVSAILREAKIEIDEEEHLKLSSSKKSQEIKEEYLDLNELISTKRDDLAPLTSTIKDKQETKKIEEEKKEDIKTPILEAKEEELLKELNASKNILNNVKESQKLELKQEPLLIKEESKDKFNSDELFVLDRDEKKKHKEDKEDIEDIDSELFIKEIKSNKVEDKDEVLTIDTETRDETIVEKSGETKILDKDEIFNIKTLLNDEATDSKLSLEDVMTPPSSSNLNSEEQEQKQDKPKKKKKKKSKNIQKIEVANRGGKEAIKKVFSDTVSSLPIEEFRQLLRGTKIHITIEFPKEV
jgi:hypothetical protein